MAYLRVGPDKLDDTQAQLAADHLVSASPRGWEDASRVLQTGLPEATQQLFVQGRSGAANAAKFFGVLREIQAGVDVLELLAAQPGAETTALLPRTLNGLYSMLSRAAGCLYRRCRIGARAGSAGRIDRLARHRAAVA